MDYKQLDQVVTLMGGFLSYSFEDGKHSYMVKIGRSGHMTRDSKEYLGIKNVCNFLKEMFPISFSNTLNQLNIEQ